MDTIEKLQYRVKAGIVSAKEELDMRLKNKILLPLQGINNEKIYLTGINELTENVSNIKKLYKKVPESQRVSTVILLEAHSSATIEGAHTTVERVKECIEKPETKDEMMVVNALKGSKYAYNNKISAKNIRTLWEIVVKDVCENGQKAGSLYREGMVYIGNGARTVHTP